MSPRILTESLQTSNATVVRVSYFGTQYSYCVLNATGDAWRERGDAHNPELAEALATARALDSLSAKLKRRARGLMNEAENDKLTRARSKEHRKALEAIDLYIADHGFAPAAEQEYSEDDLDLEEDFVEVGPPVDPDANVWEAIGDPVEGEPRQPPQNTAWLEMEEQQTPRDSKGRFHRRWRDES